MRAIARRYAGRGEELDDLVQAGSVGLVKASTRFDPTRGVAFGTFATPAVEGAIRRHLSERARGARLGPTAQRASTDTDASDAPVDRSDEPESLAESEYRVLLAGGMRALDERERRIVFLRFHADMTERQIAQSVGISQAHVSRLLDGALTKLRAEFASTDPAKAADITEPEAISLAKAPEIADKPTKLADVGAHKEGVGAQPGEVAPEGTSRSAKAGYSGRFLVRMPGELHEQLAHAAERQEVSLNRYVNETLSHSVGLNPSDQAGPPASPPNGAAGSSHGSGRSSRATLRLALVANVVLVVLAGAAAIVLMVLALQRGI